MCMCAAKEEGSPAPHILVGYESGVILLWDVNTGTEVSSIQSHTETVMCLGFCPSLDLGFSGSVNHTLTSWGVKEGEPSPGRMIEITNKGLNDLVIRGDGRIVATAGWDSRIRVFSCKKLKPLAVLDFHKESIQSVSFSKGGLLAAGSKDKTISVWSVYQKS